MHFVLQWIHYLNILIVTVYDHINVGNYLYFQLFFHFKKKKCVYTNFVSVNHMLLCNFAIYSSRRLSVSEKLLHINWGSVIALNIFKDFSLYLLYIAPSTSSIDLVRNHIYINMIGMLYEYFNIGYVNDNFCEFKQLLIRSITASGNSQQFLLVTGVIALDGLGYT